MRYLVIILIVCSLVFITACESRVPADNIVREEAAPVSPDTPSGGAGQTANVPSQTAPDEPELDVIEDAAQISLARAIVFELLERAAVADEIYRVTLSRDETLEPVFMGEYYYFPVIDDRFFTVEDIQNFLGSTFSGGEATRRFDELQSNYHVYRNVNGELSVNADIQPRLQPLTTGGWQIDTMQVLLIDDVQLEVRMETTLLGIANGPRILRIVRDGENWLLGDSFFLD